MAAVATRAFVQENKDTYLCPLSKKQLSAATLSEYLAVVPTPLVREDAMGQCKEIAVGFEREVKVTHQTAVSALTWSCARTNSPKPRKKRYISVWRWRLRNWLS